MSSIHSSLPTHFVSIRSSRTNPLPNTHPPLLYTLSRKLPPSPPPYLRRLLSLISSSPHRLLIKHHFSKASSLYLRLINQLHHTQLAMVGFVDNGIDGLSGLIDGNLKNERIVDGLVFPKTFLPSDPTNAASADDLVSFVTSNQTALHELMYKHGAILFRGFAVYAVDDFSKLVESFGWEEHPYEGAANRVKRGHRVFTANEAPLNEFIPFHHEMALIKESCKKVFFHCAQPASEAGETPVLRSDAVVKQMQREIPEVVEKLRKVGIMPVQHMKNADKSGDEEVPVPGRKTWHRLLHSHKFGIRQSFGEVEKSGIRELCGKFG